MALRNFKGYSVGCHYHFWKQADEPLTNSAESTDASLMPQLWQPPAAFF
ncbi:MAG: hypothetical protein PUK70_04190 [Bacteroidales bacterium]|nr:hypothetical protein [Bacteroidales bacterium]